MKAWALGLLNLVFFSAAAGAMPHASLNQLVQQADPECDQTSSVGGLKDLLQQINIPLQRDANGNTIKEKRDPRKSLRDGGPEIGMSPEEMKRAEETTGYVVCPGSTYGNRAVGSATLIEPGNQILTVAHAFIDENSLPREPLADCFFQTQGNPAQRRNLNFTSAKMYKMFTNYPVGNSERDLAVVQLKESDKPITKYKPFALDTSGLPLVKGQRLTMISASHKDLRDSVKFPPTSPIVQTCRYWDGAGTHGSRKVGGIFSDCASAKGASGSIQMVRKSNGQLAIRGIVAEGGTDPDFSEYSPNTSSHTYAVELTPAILSELNDFQMANANTRTFSQEAANRGL